eukprot:3094030-Prymnesium_polylepis.1
MGNDHRRLRLRGWPEKSIGADWSQRFKLRLNPASFDAGIAINTCMRVTVSSQSPSMQTPSLHLHRKRPTNNHLKQRQIRRGFRDTNVGRLPARTQLAADTRWCGRQPHARRERSAANEREATRAGLW